MENFFQAGELTVIAGRPGAGKTTLLCGLVKKYGQTDPVTLNFGDTTDFFETLRTLSANKNCKCILIENLPTKQKDFIQKSLQTLKQLALSRNIAVVATYMLSRDYLRNGALDPDAVKADLRETADRLFIIDRPPDPISHGANTLIRIYGDRADPLCFFC